MSSEPQIVPVAVVEESHDVDVRRGHHEFTVLFGITPNFCHVESDCFSATLKNLNDDPYPIILVSRPLIDRVPLENLVLDPVSESTRCVNVITYNDGVWHGTNTDFIGIHYALTSAVTDPHNRDAMLIGSGPWLRATAFVLVKHFAVRSFFMPFTEHFDVMRQYIQSLDNKCVVVNLSNGIRETLPGTISCVVTDVPLAQQDDPNHPFRNMLSAVFETIDWDPYSPFQGVFLNLGFRQGDDVGWSQLLNSRAGWTTVELPSLRLATVPATWEMLGFDDLTVFSERLGRHEQWNVDRPGAISLD
ncbi:hypothetical protein K435DRAFT_872526 [Dendrothele bispora CBS 962.96]|uniref:Uncharacterized protein n=1 Tax=Dendrothele bispora (strain CBS 962.96) TaxID=1314807 RepID=A0A4V4HC75_DENBC|nr:hypothetical protein K435DRAFT_872526 [Dendrothele bispora CBS 962.96]